MIHPSAETPSAFQLIECDPHPRSDARVSVGRGWNASALVLALAAIAPIAGYLLDQPAVLWAAAGPALWLAFQRPHLLVLLILVTNSCYPVLRILGDDMGARSVSTKGLFFSADDPLMAALAVAWLAAILGRKNQRVEWFPGALLGLAALYPCGIAVNLLRLEPSQAMISFLYYVKWMQYAMVVFAIPRVVGRASATSLVSGLRRLLPFMSCAAAAFAVYETAMALGTGSYTSAASFPRASAFFGTLDPRRFGASEDPVNFGVWAMVAGSLAIGFLDHSQSGSRSSHLAAAVGSVVSIVLSASRSPVLAAVVAIFKLQRLRSPRMVAGLAAVAGLAVAAVLIAPESFARLGGRFEILTAGSMATERSAVDRLAIIMNSPVFQMDEYWLVGHGHSSFRFAAEAHLSSISGGVSRSLYNFALTVWYDAGIGGVILWALLFVALNRRFGSLARNSTAPELRALARGLRGALWGLAMAACFSEIPYNWRIMGLFYIATGVLLAAQRAAPRPVPGVLIVPRGQS